MPRVNRDLQRRMAARRERERRRPVERRYRFGTPEPTDAELVDGSAAEADADAQAEALPARAASAVRAPAARAEHHTPFSAYASEYAYVLRDLRRVGAVMGSLLVILIVLYFVLPH